MGKKSNSGIMKSVLLAAALGGALYQEIIAANSKPENQPHESAGSQTIKGGSEKSKPDTVLADTIFGSKVFFRIEKRKLIKELAKSTDVSLEGVAENDSTIFLYSDTVDFQKYSLQKIPGNPRNSYLLRIQTIPASPPSGNGFVVITPVRGTLTVIAPGRLRFNGHLPKLSQEKSNRPDGGFSVHVWNGNIGIQLPLVIHAADDSAFLKLAIIDSAIVSKSTVYNFSIVEQQDKEAYLENETITMYLDLGRKQKLRIKTPAINDIEIQSVWVSMSSKRRRHSIQGIFNDCEDRKNALLQVKMNGKTGFISYEDFAILGYQDAG